MTSLCWQLWQALTPRTLPRSYFKTPEATDIDFFSPVETKWKTTCSGSFLLEAMKTNCWLRCSTSDCWRLFLSHLVVCIKRVKKGKKKIE